MTVVASPCINICQISGITGQCAGCYRTLEEIENWWDMSPEQQRALLLELEQRELKALTFG